MTIVAGTVALDLGWRWRIAYLLLMPLPLTLMAGLVPRAFPAHCTAGLPRPHLRVLVQQVWFSGASAALFLSAATELGMAQWLAASAETARGYPAWVGGAILLDFSIPMAAGRMAMGVAGHRHDPNRLMAAGCAL